MLAHACLTREHEGVGAVEDCVGHVAGLGARGSRRRGHGVEHLSCHDHGLRGDAAQLDGALLDQGHHLEREFDSKIAARDHDPVERRDDLHEVVHRLRLLHLGQDRHADALFVHDSMDIGDVCCRADEGQCDEIAARAQPPAQVVDVLLRQGRHADGDTGEVEPLVVRHAAALDDAGDDARARDVCHLERHSAVVDEDGVADSDVTRQAGVRRRDHVPITRHIVGRHREGVAHRQQHRTRGEAPQTDLGALQIDEDADRTSRDVARLTHPVVGRAVVVVTAVAEVEAGDIHAGLDKAQDLLVRTRRRPQGGDDLRAAHGPPPGDVSGYSQGYTVRGLAEAGIGEGRFDLPVR